MEKKKSNLAPNIRMMLKGLFDKLSNATATTDLTSSMICKVVSKAFSVFLDAHNNLKTEGFDLDPLPYDQALSLVTLVSSASNKSVVLILDAWEKSPSVQFEYNTFLSFLEYHENWPQTHIFLGVRIIENNPTKIDQITYERSKELAESSARVEIYTLKEMKLDTDSERDNLIDYLNQEIKFTKKVGNDVLIGLIGGYPGVLNFWLDGNDIQPITNVEKLNELASDANNLRYSHLKHKLSNLKESEITIVARLACLSQMTEEKWHVLKTILLKDIEEEVVDDLKDSKLLESKSFPFYGHATRHEYLQNWFIENKPAKYLRILNFIIESLAINVTHQNNSTRVIIEEIVACSPLLDRLRNSSSISRCLLSASLTYYDKLENILKPEFDIEYNDALKNNEHFAELFSIALYNRALYKVRHGDYEGEIADHSAIINMTNASNYAIAKSHCSRGIAYEEMQLVDKALSDYSQAIEIKDAPFDLLCKAYILRGTLSSVLNKAQAINDFDAIINHKDASIFDTESALNCRAITKARHKDYPGSNEDFTKIIDLDGITNELKARALRNRGSSWLHSKNYSKALKDFTESSLMSSISNNQKAVSLLSRAELLTKYSNLDNIKEIVA